ncbi:MAG: hypothetical protein AB7F67_18830 [Rhodospirillaceae bacterium]
MTTQISEKILDNLAKQLRPLLGVQFHSLALPLVALQAFEPSQVGTIVGTLMDALIPHLPNAKELGLTKGAGILGEREGYPDYVHNSGYRFELKLIYVDNPKLVMKRPPTRREPSARLTQKVTVKNVNPMTDAMLLISYQLQPSSENKDAVSPTIIDYRVFSMIDLIIARDRRLIESGGRWFGNYETPAVISKIGKVKIARNMPLDTSVYGRKESEGKDFNEDTNFGKLKRIPHIGLQRFIKECQALSVGVSVDRIEQIPEVTDDDELPKLLDIVKNRRKD